MWQFPLLAILLSLIAKGWLAKNVSQPFLYYYGFKQYKGKYWPVPIRRGNYILIPIGTHVMEWFGGFPGLQSNCNWYIFFCCRYY